MSKVKTLSTMAVSLNSVVMMFIKSGLAVIGDKWSSIIPYKREDGNPRDGLASFFTRQASWKMIQIHPLGDHPPSYREAMLDPLCPPWPLIGDCESKDSGR